MSHYPFTPTFAPGAPRPDLAHMITRHGYRVWPRRAVAMIHADSMVRETHPENFYEVGTDLRGWYGYAARVIASADCANDILIRHRRMAHRAWVRAIEQDDDDELAAHNAWFCARRYCGLPT